MMTINQITMLYTLNFYNDVCQLYLSKTGKGEKTYHALTPYGSLTSLFALATAWAMSSFSKAEKEVVRSENNLHGNFILSLG